MNTSKKQSNKKKHPRIKHSSPNTNDLLRLLRKTLDKKQTTTPQPIVPSLQIEETNLPLVPPLKLDMDDIEHDTKTDMSDITILNNLIQNIEQLSENVTASSVIRNLIHEGYQTIQQQNKQDQLNIVHSIFQKCDRLFTHGTRQFSMEGYAYDYNIPVLSYKAGVCIDDKYVYKFINCNDIIFCTFFILKEIAFQKYAYSLSRTCNIEIPFIYAYGKVRLSELPPLGENIRPHFKFNTLWYIQMTKIPFQNLKSQIGSDIVVAYCNELSNRINEAIVCLEENGMYHNDAHSENIFIDVPEHKIALIDYGEAETYDGNPFQDKKYNCERLGKRSGGGGRRRLSRRKKQKKRTTRKRHI
jgi:hypothetical protein